MFDLNGFASAFTIHVRGLSRLWITFCQEIRVGILAFPRERRRCVEIDLPHCRREIICLRRLTSMSTRDMAYYGIFILGNCNKNYHVQ